MAQDPTRLEEPSIFKAIERESTLANRVAGELEALILSHQLAPGHRLLSERELGERFGVSRTVVREAVRSLAAKGLLEVRTGDGTYVLGLDSSNASEALSRLLRAAGVGGSRGASAVFEVRRPLEVAIAGMAAERASPEEVTALEMSLQAMSDPGTLGIHFAEADVEFHAALARATQNQLFVALMNSVVDLMKAVRDLGVTVAGSRESALQEHRLILDRVKAKDGEGARQAMANHMDTSESILDTAVAAQSG